MPPRCRVNGCEKPSAGHSHLCSKHRSRKRRHGHEGQRTVSKADLKPFIEKVHCVSACNFDPQSGVIGVQN